MRSALKRFISYEASAPVTWLLAFVTAGVYAGQRLGPVWRTFPAPVGPVDQIWRAFGYVRYLVLHGEPWRIITPNLIHTTDWGRAYVPRGLLHMLGVVVSLVVIGPLVERIYGHRKLLVIYVASGTAGYAVLLGLNRDPFLQGGATGAVFGVAGAYLVYAIRHGREQRDIVPRAIVMFVLMAAVQYGWDATNPRIIHAGGVAAGFLLGLLLEPRDRVRATPPPPVARPTSEDLGVV